MDSNASDNLVIVTGMPMLYLYQTNGIKSNRVASLQVEMIIITDPRLLQNDYKNASVYYFSLYIIVFACLYKYFILYIRLLYMDYLLSS